ncbi:Predicted acyltransferase [Duganella sp. CF458]|uniref:acyltransferase family protein n=1 Tax=Duganella sp. CF458 TaxID=1884368 RepID=UPI0008DF4E6F|nr:heparan-alpha-glucosaminide N-acetyltransferase domain-containing protein [Duganella sp. CF458]SFG73487.1 Predicted acyltransferase [Duganella sp. CF458]
MNAATRYQSLDVLRGLTVALMIIVNTPGSWSYVYTPLLHAPWHGFTPTDWVFPSFLFVVGNALAFTLPRYEGMGSSAVLAKIGKRTVTIVALGLLLCLLPKLGGPLSDVRLPGVLQRIGLCFGIAALVLHYLSGRGALAVSVVALLGHWLVMALFGDYSLDGNAGRAVDLWVFGSSHLYKGEGIPFDPEGLLGTLPATVNVIGGYFAGRYLRENGATSRTLGVLAAAGVVLSALALLWAPLLPINKKLWTGSYVLFSTGTALLALAALAWVIEVRGAQRWTYFFEVFGKNTLFIYMLSQVAVVALDKTGTYAPLAAALGPIGSPKAASLAFALLFMLACWLVGYWLDKRRIYIKV